MANKTATLKNQAGDNIYPNIVGDNRNAAIKDSTTIKHTLVDNKISLDLDESIKEKINAAGGSVSPTLNLINFENGEIRTSITEEEYNNLKKGLYNSVNYYTEGEYDTYLPSKLISVYDDSDESLTSIFSSIKITGTSETDISSTNIIYQLNIGQKDTSGNYPITIEKAIEIPFGSSSGGGDSGAQIVDCTLIDQEDITKGGTVNSVPEAPFLLRIPLNLKNEGSYGKHLVDNILVPMNYTYGKFEHSGEGKVVPDRYFGVGLALSTFCYASVDISTKKVYITTQVNASYMQLPVDLPTKSQPTVTISNPKEDILMQPMLVGNDFWLNGVVLYGYFFSWASPVYSNDHPMFYSTASYGDVNNTLTIRYHEIPASTTTIAFED